MEPETYLRFVLALVFVLALIGLAAWLARRFGLAGAMPLPRGRRRRLAVIESVAIDGKRRLVLVRRDATEHLLLLGAGPDLLVESAIAPPPEALAEPLPEAPADKPGKRPVPPEETPS